MEGFKLRFSKNLYKKGDTVRVDSNNCKIVVTNNLYNKYTFNYTKGWKKILRKMKVRLPAYKYVYVVKMK